MYLSDILPKFSEPKNLGVSLFTLTNVCLLIKSYGVCWIYNKPFFAGQGAIKYHLPNICGMAFDSTVWDTNPWASEYEKMEG